MTNRKPPNVSFDNWVDQQIREAQARGAFDNLPGAGKPIPDIDRPQRELDWIAKLVRRENIDPSLFLPPSLALPKEREDLRARLATERSEDVVREIVLDLIRRIREAHRRPQDGPPLLVMSVDVDRVIATWRDDRAELQRQYEASRPPPAAPPVVHRRRWWQRRARATPGLAPTDVS